VGNHFFRQHFEDVGIISTHLPFLYRREDGR
jgi:hypothetical protein